MKALSEIKKDERIKIVQIGEDGGYAYIDFSKNICMMERPTNAIAVFSWGGGWDHVSVSYPNRCCTWEEMCILKDMFFKENECVIQYHPPKKDHINIHPYCLHLWKPQKEKMPIPPKWMIG